MIIKNENIIYEDALKLVKFVSGGYDNDDGTDFISLSTFNRCKENFPLLRDLYARVRDCPEMRRLNIDSVKGHNLLAMVYLSENIGKMKKAEAERVFKKLKIVW